MRQRQPGRSNTEWMELITQCRQSGLSDSMWCEQQGIPASTFYNAVTRLRKMACAIPAPSKKAKLSMDFTAKQEVVKIDIVPDCEADPEMLTPVPAMQASPEYFDNSYKIEIILGAASIRVGDGADPELLEAAIRTLRAHHVS